MAVNIYTKFISEIVERSDGLRRRVNKAPIGDGLREFLGAIYAQEPAEIKIALRKIDEICNKQKIDKEEIILETIRSVRISSESILVKSLDSHYRYFWRKYFGDNNPGFLEVNLSRLRGGSGDQIIDPGDALFHVCLNIELGESDNYMAFPVFHGGILYGWVFVNNKEPGLGRDEWPQIVEEKGILQTTTRHFRHRLSSLELTSSGMTTPRFIVLLESGLNTARSLYLSDPITGKLSQNPTSFLDIIEHWRSLIEKIKNPHTTKSSIKSKKPIIIPRNIPDRYCKDISDAIRTYADNIDSARIYDLPNIILTRMKSNFRFEHVLWNVLEESIGWRTAVRIKRSKNGNWTWDGDKLGDAPPLARKELFKKQKSPIEETLLEIAQKSAELSDTGLHLVSGGYFQGWGSALAIPIAKYNERSDPQVFIIMTDQFPDWTNVAARKIDELLENIANQVNERFKFENIDRLEESLPEELSLSGKNWYSKGLACAEGTSFFHQVWKLDNAVVKWSGGNQDVVIIGGESRAGKEYVLKNVLKKHDYKIYKYEASTLCKDLRKILKKIDNDTATKKAIIIDEFFADSRKSDTRPLLPFLAKDESIINEFSIIDCMICLITSGKSLLEDVVRRSREEYIINIPGLNEHSDDIPWIIASTIYRNGRRMISRAAMRALLRKNWLYAKEIDTYVSELSNNAVRGDTIKHLDLSSEYRISHWPRLDNVLYKIKP